MSSGHFFREGREHKLKVPNRIKNSLKDAISQSENQGTIRSIESSRIYPRAKNRYDKVQVYPEGFSERERDDRRIVLFSARKIIAYLVPILLTFIIMRVLTIVSVNGLDSRSLEKLGAESTQDLTNTVNLISSITVFLLSIALTIPFIKKNFEPTHDPINYSIIIKSLSFFLIQASLLCLVFVIFSNISEFLIANIGAIYLAEVLVPVIAMPLMLFLFRKEFLDQRTILRSIIAITAFAALVSIVFTIARITTGSGVSSTSGVTAYTIFGTNLLSTILNAINTTVPTIVTACFLVSTRDEVKPYGNRALALAFLVLSAFLFTISLLIFQFAIK
jgi:hypothetical protein